MMNKKVKKLSEKEVADIERKALALKIDQFGELYNRLAPEIDRLETLKKELAIEVAKETSDEGVSLIGTKYIIDYSKPKETLVCAVDMKEYIKSTGAYDTLTVSITKAKATIPAPLFGTLFTKVKGNRVFRRIRSI